MGWSEPWLDGHAVRFGTSRCGPFRRWWGMVQYSAGTTGGTCGHRTGRADPVAYHSGVPGQPPNP